MKIAYLNSICQKYDAISNAIREEISWLRAAGHEVRLFAYACEFDDVPCTIVDNEAQVAFDPFFQSCDLAVFHFGVYYSLFNVLPAVPRRARRMVVFHNITPKHVLPAASHALIDRSFRQMANIAFADHVVCVSHTNLGVLRAAGIDVPATVLPLAVHTQLQAPPAKPSFDDRLVRIAFVGRLVQSKAPQDLLSAVERLLGSDRRLHLRVELVANLGFSDPAVVQAVRAQIAELERRFGARIEATLHGNAPEETKMRVLTEADLFVLPTHHEGFCVPILESLASGCRVVCYDNSNTPAVAGGLGTLVPTGDVAALTSAVGADLALVCSEGWRSGGYQQAVRAAREHLSNFAVDTVRARFLNLIRQQGAHRF
jgi:glycosyltransferase involved in cell wall biosynthesis